ncbi:MAG: hypothetical protein VX589_08490 [Myxococcota bacterium]|nr:hypothetical protein [Myxococcota bacterium]
MMAYRWATRCTIAVMILLTVGLAQANIPSAYFACEGADEQDECQTPGPRYGHCVLDTKCEDPEDTEVNECLLCVDGCWGRPSGGPCRRTDGEMGRCEQQSRCTTDPEKSFNQCNRCVKLPATAAGGAIAGGMPGGATLQGGAINGGQGAAGQPASTAVRGETDRGGCTALDGVTSTVWLIIFGLLVAQRRWGRPVQPRP